MVLVTFRLIGLAHLHTLWGCLAFVGFPSGFGLVCLGLCPLGFLFAVLVGFSLGCLHLWCGLGALASRRHGVVCSRWAFALGVHGMLLWWAAAAAVAAPSLCAVYLGAVQIKVHTSPGRKLRYFVRVPLKVQRRRGSIDGTGAWISKPQKIIDFTVISLAQLGV